MKKLLILLGCSLGFCAPCFAQATLSLINPSSGPLTAGSTFTLDIDYTSTLATPALAAFDITLSGSPTQASAIPQGLTFDGFSGLVSGFSGAVSNVDANIFSASANSGANDISSTSPTILLAATFTATQAGIYSLYFAPNGTGTTDDQGLYGSTGTAITYISSGAVVTVPEPSEIYLLGLGLIGLVGFSLRHRLAFRLGQMSWVRG